MAASKNEINIDDQLEIVEIDKIDENPDNAKIYNMEEIDVLAQIIQENGFNTPINVFKKGDGRYEIISGHRRVRAMRNLGYSRIPCIIIEKPKDEVEKARRLLDSNRANRSKQPLDIAREIEYYVDNVLRPKAQEHDKREKLYDQAAKHFGMNRSTIFRYRCILKMIPELQELANDPKFPYTAFVSARHLSEELQRKLYERIKKYEKLCVDKEGEAFEVSRSYIEGEIRRLEFEEKSRMRKEREEETRPKKEVERRIHQEDTFPISGIESFEAKEESEETFESFLIPFDEAENFGFDEECVSDVGFSPFEGDDLFNHKITGKKANIENTDINLEKVDIKEVVELASNYIDILEKRVTEIKADSLLMIEVLKLGLKMGSLTNKLTV